MGGKMNEIKRKNKKERKRFVMPDDQLKLTHMLNKIMTSEPDDD